MSSIAENIKSQLSEVIQKEVENTLSRLRDGIFKALKDDNEDLEDDLDIDMEKFAKNTVKKIFSSSEFKDIVENISKNNKEKLKKDPDAPKGAKNAFVFFCADNREDVKKENPKLKSPELMKKLGEMWKDADEDMKKEYQEKAATDKKRFVQEMEEYEPKEGFKCPKKSSKAERTSPKRARSAYIFFCSDKRAEVAAKGLKNTEILKELGKMWSNLSEKKKKPYAKMAEEDKKRYDEEMKTYVPEDDDSKGKKGKKGKSAKAGEKRPLSSYMLFCKDKRDEVKKENPELKSTEITKKLGELWRGLSEKKKKKYTDMAAKLKEEYEEKNSDKNEEEENDENEEENEDKNDEDDEDEDAAEKKRKEDLLNAETQLYDDSDDEDLTAPVIPSPSKKTVIKSEDLEEDLEDEDDEDDKKTKKTKKSPKTKTTPKAKTSKSKK